jgi:hypothetical protein
MSINLCASDRIEIRRYKIDRADGSMIHPSINGDNAHFLIEIHQAGVSHLHNTINLTIY